MILIVAIGYVVDGVVFKSMEHRLQQRWASRRQPRLLLGTLPRLPKN